MALNLAPKSWNTFQDSISKKLEELGITTPTGAAGQGATADQAKMAGTPAQKANSLQSTLGEAVNSGMNRVQTTVDQAANNQDTDVMSNITRGLAQNAQPAVDQAAATVAPTVNDLVNKAREKVGLPPAPDAQNAESPTSGAAPTTPQPVAPAGPLGASGKDPRFDSLAYHRLTEDTGANTAVDPEAQARAERALALNAHAQTLPLEIQGLVKSKIEDVIDAPVKVSIDRNKFEEDFNIEEDMVQYRTAETILKRISERDDPSDLEDWARLMEEMGRTGEDANPNNYFDKDKITGVSTAMSEAAMMEKMTVNDLMGDSEDPEGELADLADALGMSPEDVGAMSLSEVTTVLEKMQGEEYSKGEQLKKVLNDTSLPNGVRQDAANKLADLGIVDEDITEDLFKDTTVNFGKSEKIMIGDREYDVETLFGEESMKQVVTDIVALGPNSKELEEIKKEYPELVAFVDKYRDEIDKKLKSEDAAYEEYTGKVEESKNSYPQILDGMDEETRDMLGIPDHDPLTGEPFDVSKVKSPLIKHFATLSPEQRESVNENLSALDKSDLTAGQKRNLYATILEMDMENLRAMGMFKTGSTAFREYVEAYENHYDLMDGLTQDRTKDAAYVATKYFGKPTTHAELVAMHKREKEIFEATGNKESEEKMLLLQNMLSRPSGVLYSMTKPSLSPDGSGKVKYTKDGSFGEYLDKPPGGLFEESSDGRITPELIAEQSALNPRLAEHFDTNGDPKKDLYRDSSLRTSKESRPPDGQLYQDITAWKAVLAAIKDSNPRQAEKVRTVIRNAELAAAAGAAYHVVQDNVPVNVANEYDRTWNANLPENGMSIGGYNAGYWDQDNVSSSTITAWFGHAARNKAILAVSIRNYEDQIKNTSDPEARKQMQAHVNKMKGKLTMWSTIHQDISNSKYSRSNFNMLPKIQNDTDFWTKDYK